MPTELTDDEVFGAPATAELSDADVFGSPPAPVPNGPQTAADLMSGRFTDEQRRAAMKNIRIPTMSEVGAVPAEAVEGAIRYATPVGLAQKLAEVIDPSSAVTKLGKGAIAGTSEALAAFTTPESLSQLAIMPASRIGQILLNLGFAAHAIGNLPEQIKAFGATDDPAEKAKIVTGITASLGLPALGVAHGALRKPANLTERLFPNEAPPDGTYKTATGEFTIQSDRPTSTTLTEKLFPEAKDSIAESAAPSTVQKVTATSEEAPPAAIPASDLKQILDRYDSASDQTFSTIADVANALADRESLPPKIQDALRNYEAAKRADREEFGERSGLPEDAGDALITALEEEVGEPTSKGSQTASQDSSTTQVSFSHITDLNQLYKEGGQLIAKATTPSEIRGAQEAMRQRASEIEAAQTPDIGPPTSGEEARLKAEHEQGLLSDFQESQSRTGDEFYDALEKAGGLKAISALEPSKFSGELQTLREEYKGRTGESGKERLAYNKIFKRDAPDEDMVVQRMRESGFEVETPDDLIRMAQERLRSGKPIYGNQARTAALEEAPSGFGPGAASAKEPLATYEQRRFGKRFQADESIAPEIREQTGNQFYEPISNVKTVAEAEAIIEDYGTDTAARLVRDDAAPLEPRVRSTVAQGLIKKLNQSYQEAKAAGDTPRAQEFLDQSVDTAEYLSELGTKLGQGVQSFAIWSKLSPEGILASAKRIAKRSGTELSPEAQQKILDLTDEIHKAPEGFQKDEKTMALMNYMADLKGVNPAEVPTALWYSNILSGFTTQLVNTIDTGLNVLSESAAMAASHPTAVPDILSGLYQGMVKGGFEAANVLKTGRSVTGDKVLQQRVLERVKFGEPGVPMNTDTAIGRFMKAAFESKPAKILNLWKYPLRAMVASDTVFYNSFREARARVLARAMAKKEGLSGDALFERVDQLLNETPGKKEAALAQAKAEGLEGINLARRSREIIEQGRPEDLVSSADEAAAIATYNHDPSGVLGLVAHHISQITDNFPPAKFVVPFTRIVANVTNRGLDYTPWGYKRLFFGEWGGKKFGSEPPVGEAYRTQLAKATAGTVAMAALGALDANDKIQVTAKGPEDPDERKQLLAAGWRPYSVRVGDTYFSYQYVPLNLGLAMIGHYRDAVRYNKLSEKDAQTRLAYGMLKASSTIFDMSFLSGVSDFIETVQGATSSTKGAGRLFARTASSIVVPNIVKQVDKVFDPTIYQADDIQQALVRETPVARSLTQKPMLNALGEPIKGSQNKFFAFANNDPVWKLITEKQAWVPIPSKTTKIGKRPITPDEYYRLIQQSGPRIRGFIENRLERFRDMPAEDVQNEIRDAATHERDRVKRKFR